MDKNLGIVLYFVTIIAWILLAISSWSMVVCCWRMHKRDRPWWDNESYSDYAPIWVGCSIWLFAYYFY